MQHNIFLREEIPLLVLYKSKNFNIYVNEYLLHIYKKHYLKKKEKAMFTHWDCTLY